MNGIFVDKCRKNFQSSVVRHGERGFSLLEVMVAMVVFMIVIGSVYGLLQVGLIDRNRASRRSDVLKNARAAVHLIGRDVLNAGLGYNKSGAIVPDNFVSTRLGLPADADAERDVLTAVVGGNNLFSNILDGAARTDVVAFAYRDVGFNNGNVIALTDAAATSGDPASVTLSTPANQARNSRVYDLYLVESQNSQVAVMATAIPTNNRSIVAAPGDPLTMLGINQPLNGTGESRSVLKKCSTPGEDDCMDYTATVAKRFFWVAYKVKADGTLVRMIFGNNSGATAAEQIQEMPIAYNIQDLQVQYVLEDGTVTENPYFGTNGASNKWENFNLVRQITITIKVQATEDDEQLKRPETITLNATFSARNLEYDAG